MRFVLFFILGGLIASCSQQQIAQLQTPPGQLFCQLATPSGAIIAPIVVQKASANGGAASGALAVIVTNALAADVASACTQAALNAGAASGTPVPPPTSAPAAAVPVVLPNNTTLKTS